MKENLKTFGETAKGLAKNPLGVIALFIVLVYGVAALVTTFARSMEAGERQPLIWFLVLFPPIVLAVFAWLVSRHPDKLYGPGDFRSDETYRKILLGQLEAKVTTTARSLATSPESGAGHERIHSDSRLAIAQVRLQVERELFLLSHALNTRSIEFEGHYRVGPEAQEERSISASLGALEKKGEINSDLASSLREFVQLANATVHGERVEDAEAQRSVTVGTALLTRLRHKRLVAELMRDFDGHLLWHHQRKMATDGEATEKYAFWSAVAASLPDFEYDYEAYAEAANRHNELMDQRGHDDRKLYVLSLLEFVSVLKFREMELERICKSWGSGGWKTDEEIHWQWPDEWGDVGWNGPILRERRYLKGAEEDLMRARVAIAHYRAGLSSSE